MCLHFLDYIEILNLHKIVFNKIHRADFVGL